MAVSHQRADPPFFEVPMATETNTTRQARRVRFVSLGMIGMGLHLGGCVGQSRVLQVAPNEGSRALYRVPLDTFVSHVPSALVAIGRSVSYRSAPDSSVALIVGTNGLALLGSGGYARVRAQAINPSVTEVRVVSRSRSLLGNSGYASRATPRILRAIDSGLGPSHILPFVDMVVRGHARGDTLLREGTVAPDGAGGFVVQWPGLPALPIKSLSATEVLRGEFTRGSEGTAIGGGLGALVGLVAAFTICDDLDCAVYAPFVSVAVGGLFGFVIGRSVRTRIWSPADFSGLGGR
jgi:hypothetical protein